MWIKKENRKSVIVSKTYKFVESNIENINNKFIIYDNTLPRTNIKDCPNRKCLSYNNPSKREAVFYPDKKTRELNYVCCHCYTTWKLS